MNAMVFSLIGVGILVVWWLATINLARTPPIMVSRIYHRLRYGPVVACSIIHGSPATFDWGPEVLINLYRGATGHEQSFFADFYPRAWDNLPRRG